ncbi:hypothetical protein CU633_03805 [Bacillus sp. V3-13]|uniref:DUF4127 family protein n=1 Tax=Bacillus sp. V3-13 TaxID=2053728 RepID=UPI000C756A32|nr:DUF4127 family protein [Bacillus sp. V3-13]PLR78688.1 hypothetical protein CU633_03805 [Bacillus sp. V3-13]
MKYCKGILSIALAVLLIFSSLGKIEATQIKKPLATVVLVPLDDRPANTYFPRQVGKSAGIEVVIPPKEMIGSFTSPGNGQRIGQWLLEHGKEADGFVISTSMLAYGGLVASRTGTKSLEDATADIQVIKKLKEMYPEKPVYVFDTIQRLAVTAISEEYLKYYSQISEWAILYDKVVNLGMPGKERLDELESIIPPSVLQDYKKARERNHFINKLMIDWADQDYIDYLILSQDDAAPYGLHRAERESLLEKVKEVNAQEKVAVFPGADEVGVVLVSRFVNQLFHNSPSFYIEYGGIDGKDWIAPFEDTTFDYNVRKHITAAGATITQDEQNADIHLILNTPSPNNAFRDQDIDKMVSRIQTLITSGKQVAIGDVLIVNKADEAFVNRLAEKVDLTKLLSYSGWNTAGNALGITVGHAAARYSFVEQKSGFGVPVYDRAATAHYEFLLHRFAKDQGYKNVVHPAAREFIKQIGASEWDLGNKYEPVNNFVIEQLTAETEKWYQHFDGKRVYIGSRGNKDFYKKITSLADVHVKLPWPRIFEAELEPEIELD